MATLLLTSSWPLVSVMVWPFSDELKLIVSPSAASWSACRSDPGPLSFVFVTVKVAPSRAGKPAAPTVRSAIRRRVRACFIGAFLSFPGFWLSDPGRCLIFGGRTDMFLSGKAESGLETRQLFQRAARAAVKLLSLC
jgi:hypothetical protein